MMRKFIYFSVIFSFFLVVGNAQMSLHNTHWLIGSTAIPVDFSTFPPQSRGVPTNPNNDYVINNAHLRNCLAVSNELGELEFLVQYRLNMATNNPTYHLTPKVFDKYGNAFPHGDLFIKFNTIYAGVPIVVPYPYQNNKYILFYSSNNGLYYSVVDMTLNNGLGDVDPFQKDIMLANLGSVLGLKMTVVEACEDRIWLIIGSLYEKAYYSYLIDNSGVNHNKVISNVGNFDLATYKNSDYSLTKASNNGKYIVAATNEGTEIYDFEKCSGKLKNARILDTTLSRGVVFSPDDSKLYISTYKNLDFLEGLVLEQHRVGEIYQFDFNQPSFEDIQNSKTIVMRNPIYELLTIMGPKQYSGNFGQMKIGIDGKLYVSKNGVLGYSEPCYLLSPNNQQAIPTPPNNSCVTGQYLHVIHQPNELGMACEPELDYVRLNDYFNSPPGIWLQQDIIPANFQPIDSLNGNQQELIICFDDQTILFIPKDAECPVWDDGSSEEVRVITESGKYWLEYYNRCSFQRDSFDVVFVPLPQINSQFYGCPGRINIDILASDSFEYTFTLRNSDQELIATITGSGELQLTELNEGTHYLQIQALNFCDTIIQIELHAYPEPELILFPIEKTIAYGDSIQLSASGAQFYHWSPSGPLDSATLSNPWAKPLEPTWFSVLGINQYGCVDTSGLFIDIDYAMPDFIPNAFSPNNDGLNDVFKIEGLRHQKVVQFKIFNRLGQEIFSTSNVDIGWDGTFQGKPCDVGVYYYIVEIANPIGRNEVIKGEVTLVR